MNSQRIQKLITFTPQLYQLLEEKATRLGISFPEYIRALAVNDVKKGVEYALYLSEEEEQGVEESLRNIQKGEYTILQSDKEVEKHFKNLQ